MASNLQTKRNNPFARSGTLSSEPGVPNGRPKSAILAAPPSSTPAQNLQTHNRHQSYSSLGNIVGSNNNNVSLRYRSNSKTIAPSSNTFAPSFINSEEMRLGAETVKAMEGENDFSGKRYVWLKDPQTAFVKGWIVEELENNHILVQCDDGSVSYRQFFSHSTF